MDSKIILAVLIVALIGIVAATYQSETHDVMNSLANVATEDSGAAESVTDLAQVSGDGANSVKVDESVVQPDSSVNSKVVSTPKSSNNNNQQNPTTQTSSNTNERTSDSGNSGSSSSNSGTNNNGNSPSNSGSSANTNTQPSNSSNTNNQNSHGQQSGISEAEAMSIAKNNLPSGVTSDYQKVSETTINGKTYYEVNLYKNGEVIAYSEIDSSNGKITGGAIKGEAPEV